MLCIGLGKKRFLVVSNSARPLILPLRGERLSITDREVSASTEVRQVAHSLHTANSFPLGSVK